MIPAVSTFADPAALGAAAARRVEAACRRAISERGRFRLVLAGGSTPRRLYQRLAADGDVDWSRTEIFFGDERCVPPAHPASNFGMVRRTLLDHIAASPAFVGRIRGELPPATAAARLRAQIAARCGADLPRFDLVLLGMGADGHTASLFPGGPELAEDRLAAVVSRAPVAPHARVTLTLPVLNAARAVLLLVTGADKAAALARVLRELEEPGRDPLPAARVRPVDGTLTWLVDAAAGGP